MARKSRAMPPVVQPFRRHGHFDLPVVPVGAARSCVVLSRSRWAAAKDVRTVRVYTRDSFLPPSATGRPGLSMRRGRASFAPPGHLRFQQLLPDLVLRQPGVPAGPRAARSSRSTSSSLTSAKHPDTAAEETPDDELPLHPPRISSGRMRLCRGNRTPPSGRRLRDVGGKASRCRPARGPASSAPGGPARRRSAGPGPPGGDRLRVAAGHRRAHGGNTLAGERLKGRGPRR